MRIAAMQHFKLCDPGSSLMFKAQVGCVLLLPATGKNYLGDACSPPPSMRRLYFCGFGFAQAFRFDDESVPC